LVLRSRCYLPSGSKVVQESRDFGFAEARRMPLAIEVDELADPVAIGLFRALAEVAPADRLMHLLLYCLVHNIEKLAHHGYAS